jgi:hypothetical protein
MLPDGRYLLHKRCFNANQADTVGLIACFYQPTCTETGEAWQAGSVSLHISTNLPVLKRGKPVQHIARSALAHGGKLHSNPFAIPGLAGGSVAHLATHKRPVQLLRAHLHVREDCAFLAQVACKASQIA